MPLGIDKATGLQRFVYYLYLYNFNTVIIFCKFCNFLLYVQPGIAHFTYICTNCIRPESFLLYQQLTYINAFSKSGPNYYYFGDRFYNARIIACQFQRFHPYVCICNFSSLIDQIHACTAIVLISYIHQIFIRCLNLNFPKSITAVS